MNKEETIKVEVVYCSGAEVASQPLLLRGGATIEEAIARSRMLERFAQIDLKQNKVGVFGTIKKLNTPLRHGDRVEIYRPITCDPESVARRDRKEQDDEDEE